MPNNTLKKQSIRAIFVVVAMMSLSACSTMSLKPNAQLLTQVPQGAPETYQQGWKDGCESGMAIAGNQVYKVAYKNKIDPELVSDTQYYRGWSEAKTYCAHYTMAMQWEGGVLPTTPTEETLIPTESQNVFSIAASWGASSVIGWGGNSSEEQEEGEGFAGFYRN
jgi:hypothetical protein